jgi:hypothetical protein
VSSLVKPVVCNRQSTAEIVSRKRFGEIHMVQGLCKTATDTHAGHLAGFASPYPVADEEKGLVDIGHILVRIAAVFLIATLALLGKRVWLAE